jgi:hypothetical protein
MINKKNRKSILSTIISKIFYSDDSSINQNMYRDKGIRGPEIIQILLLFHNLREKNTIVSLWYLTATSIVRDVYYLNDTGIITKHI